MIIRNKTKFINWLGVLAALWLMFYPVYYNLAVFMNISIIIIAILFVLKHRGKVGIEARKWDNTPIPKIDTAILSSSFALILRAVLDIKIIGLETMFIYSMIISIPLICILFYGTKEYLVRRKIFVGLIWAMLFTSTFGCGTIILGNAILDQSQPKLYKSKIISKELEKGKYYKIYFEPWGPIKTIDLMRVSRAKFESLNANDSIVSPPKSTS